METYFQKKEGNPDSALTANAEVEVKRSPKLICKTLIIATNSEPL